MRGRWHPVLLEVAPLVQLLTQAASETKELDYDAMDTEHRQLLGRFMVFML